MSWTPLENIDETVCYCTFLFFPPVFEKPMLFWDTFFDPYLRKSASGEKPAFTPWYYKTTQLLPFIMWLSDKWDNCELLNCRTKASEDSSGLWNLLVLSVTRTWCLLCLYYIKALWATVRNLVSPWTITFARWHP